jgi:hypothetical protein
MQDIIAMKEKLINKGNIRMLVFAGKQLFLSNG